jgi:sulfur-oxidizing protein SoxY
MNPLRRSVLHALALSGALAAGLVRPLRALAREWNGPAFDAREVGRALQAADLADASPSEDIVIKAPEIAENGAQVPIEVLSKLPGAQTIYLFVDKNPQPFVGSFAFLGAAEPFIATRIKMGETSNLRVVVRAGGKAYVALREIKVTIGGCGT